MTGFTAKKLFFKACSVLPFGLLSRLSNHSLFIPIYHAVADEPLAHMDYIMPYGSKTIKQFEADLDQYLRYLKPVDFHTLKSCIDNRRPLPQNSFIVTFDDGLRHAYENAVPLLLKKGIPAIFFINVSAVDNKSLLFRYKTSVLIHHYHNTSSASPWTKVTEMLRGYEVMDENLPRALKSITYKKSFILDEVAAAIGFSFPEYLEKERPYMTTRQLQQMLDDGFILGGHSVNHPEYWLLNTEEQVQETQRSIDYLQETFDIGYRSFSFPFTDAKIKSRFFSELEKQHHVDVLFGSQKLHRDEQPNMLPRFDGDINLGSMNHIIKAHLLNNIRLQLMGRPVFLRGN